MHKLFEFIRSIYVAVLFVLFEVVVLSWYAHSTPYTQARMLTHSNRIAAAIDGLFVRARHFCSLGDENRRLTERVTALEAELGRYREADERARLADYLSDPDCNSPYEYSVARVVSNRVNRTHNYLVLDRGSADGVRSGTAVLSPSGAMVGYVVYTSKHYAAVVSMLNVGFRASGKLADGGDYFGSIVWTGSDSRHVMLRELSKYADIREGAEVLSTGFSQYFPADILIGYVESFTLNSTKTSYEAVVRLETDMTGLGEVILVRNRDLEEVQSLEEKLKNRYH